MTSTPGCDLLQLIGLDMQYVRWKPSNNNNKQSSDNQQRNQQHHHQVSRRYGFQKNATNQSQQQQHRQHAANNLTNNSGKLSQSNPNLKFNNNCTQNNATKDQPTSQNRRRESSPWPLMGDDSGPEQSVSSTSSLSSSGGGGGGGGGGRGGEGEEGRRGIVATPGAAGDNKHHFDQVRGHRAAGGGHQHGCYTHPPTNDMRECRSMGSNGSSNGQQQSNNYQKQGYQKHQQYQHQYNNQQAYRRNGYNVPNTYQNGHHQLSSGNHHQQQGFHQLGGGGSRRGHHNRYYNTFLPNSNNNNSFNGTGGGGNMAANNSNFGAQKRAFQNGGRDYHNMQMAAARCRRSQFVGEPPMFPLTNDPRFIELMDAGTPPDKFLTKANLIQITKPPQQLTNGSIWDELSKAVWNKFLTNQQTKETYEKKLTLWKCLYVYLKIVYPRYSLFMVGSTMSGFGSNTSDVDMCLMVRQTELDQRSEALFHLTHIMEHFVSHVSDFFINIELIHAKVPILKFKYINDSLDIDLSCNNTVGVRNTHLLYCYAKYDWRVRPLVLVVKLWAQWHDINDAKNTTISSYSLALMVIHFLQCGCAPAVLPSLQQTHAARFSAHQDVASIDFHSDLPPSQSGSAADNCQPIGQLLVEFFNYFDRFDYRQHAISVRQGCCLMIDECRKVRSSKNEPHQWKYLCIEEPFDLTNTARSVNNPESFEKIRNVIHQTAVILNATGSLDSIFKLDLVNGWAHTT